MGPNTTVSVAAVGGAIGVIVVWVFSLFGIVVPDTVAAAIATLFAVIFGYIGPNPRLDNTNQ